MNVDKYREEIFSSRYCLKFTMTKKEGIIKDFDYTVAYSERM